jgi:hypothetical protein
MSKREIVFSMSLMITVGSLSLAYGLDQYWSGAAAIVGLGVWGWISLSRKQNDWAPALFFISAIILITAGALLDLNIFFLLTALLATLSTWDLFRFQKRIQHAPESEGILQIEKRHLSILGLTLLGGGLVGSVMLAARIQMSFYVTLLLSVILLISMGQIIRLMRQ